MLCKARCKQKEDKREEVGGLDRVADFMQLAQFFEFVSQAMTQGTFRPQFLDQQFGFGERVLGDFAPKEQLPPTLGNFLFGKQSSTLTAGIVNPRIETVERLDLQTPGLEIWASKFCPQPLYNARRASKPELLPLRSAESGN
jgi:hypothetical protein